MCGANFTIVAEPKEYFELFMGIFGDEETRSLFPQIVSLLPVAEKRAVLYHEFARQFAPKKTPPASKSSGAKQGGRGVRGERGEGREKGGGDGKSEKSEKSDKGDGKKGDSGKTVGVSGHV